MKFKGALGEIESDPLVLVAILLLFFLFFNLLLFSLEWDDVKLTTGSFGGLE